MFTVIASVEEIRFESVLLCDFPQYRQHWCDGCLFEWTFFCDSSAYIYAVELALTEFKLRYGEVSYFGVRSWWITCGTIEFHELFNFASVSRMCFIQIGENDISFFFTVLRWHEISFL